MIRSRAPALVALCALLCCNKPAAAPAAATAPGASAPALGDASLFGHVTFHGQAPADAARPSKLAFPECSSFGPPQSTLELSASGGVASAFVWIEAGLPQGRYPVPETPVVLDQEGCEFHPRVFGIQVGQPLKIHNSDAFLHNTHAFAGGFNVPLPQAGSSVLKTFTRAGVPTVIGCDVHGWMRAYAGVVTNPFYAVTASDGSFHLTGLPAGHYTVGVWQERLGRRSVEVDVKAGARVPLEVELKPPT